MQHKRLIQSIVWTLVPVTILVGLVWPPIGFVVLAVMATGLVSGVLKGRYMCGLFCPRGAFYDFIVKHISPHRRIPAWLRAPAFRWSLVVVLMGGMALQIALDPTNVLHWGAVLVRLCLVTTAVGLVLALVYHPRTWCAFCPMGTIQGALGKLRRPACSREGCQRA